MEFILRQAHRAGIFGWLYAMSLFFAFHYFSVHFINSSFLAQFLTQTEVGFIFAISSFLTLIILASAVLFLSRIGAYYTALIAVGFDLIASLGLAFSSNIGWLFVFFVLQTIMAPVTLFCFDIFLERYTKGSSSIGFMHGLFLTMSTTASLFAPTISGWLVGSDTSYDKVYLLSVFYLIPALILLTLFFRKFDDPQYNVLSLRNMLGTLRARKNIFHISSAQFLLRFYFSWMVIYLPIYLNKYVGFSWPEIGIILFIMLIPYILIEFPAGIIADKWLGEKELLLAGFLIASASTATLFFLDTKSIMV
jgi:MFS family permease